MTRKARITGTFAGTSMALVLALAAAPGHAQDVATPPVPAPVAPATDPAAEFQALQAEWAKAQRAAIDAQRRAAEEAMKAAEEAKKAADEAKARGEPVKPTTMQAIPATSMNPGPFAEFLPRYKAFAAAHPQAPQAVDALLFVAQNGTSAGDEASAKEAAATLLRDHVDDPKMERFVMSLPRLANLVGDGAAACADVAKRTKNAEVRAAATYAPVAQTFGLGSKATDAEKKTGRVTLEALVRDLPETRWGRRAAGVLNEMDHLQVGMVAPEIEGKDVDGKPIRLSDFRGKAVLIDFWGFW